LSYLFLIADDHPLYLDAVITRLGQLYPTADLRSAASFDELLGLGRDIGKIPDLVLSDLWMPGMESADGVARILKAFPGAKLAVMSGSAKREEIQTAIRNGACGFLPKTLNAKAFESVIALFLAGGTYVPTDLMDATAPSNDATAPSALDLTPRERQVLCELASGATNKEIGAKFGRNEVTIKLHVRRVLKKIGCRNRSEAAVFCVRAGLV